MKRRQFIKSIAGLFAATQVPSVLAKPQIKLPDNSTALGSPMAAILRQMTDNLALSSHPNMGIDPAFPNSDKTVVVHQWVTDSIEAKQKHDGIHKPLVAKYADRKEQSIFSKGKS